MPKSVLLNRATYDPVADELAFNSNMNLGAGVLYIDQTNKRVGIRSPPSYGRIEITSSSGDRGIVLQLEPGAASYFAPFLVWDARNGGANYLFGVRQEGDVLKIKRYTDYWTDLMDIMAIKAADGYVGIGTFPEEKLHVSGGNILLDNNYALRWKDSGGAIREIMRISSGDILIIRSVPITSPATSISFQTSDASGNLEEVIAILGGLDEREIVLASKFADSVNTIRNSNKLRFDARYWDGAASVRLDAKLQYVITSTTPTSELRFSIAGTNRLRITDADEIVPRADNVGSIGTDTYRWSLVRAVTVTAGDVEFENKWRITEGDKVGHEKDSLCFVNPKGEVVAKIDKDGNLYLKGEVRKL